MSKLLIAHSDHFTARAIQATLREMQHSTRQARDGLEAIDQALDDPPALIILGVDLPGLNGLDAARALRALTPTQRIPILFITADATETTAVRQAGLPMVDWLQAPLDLAYLREHVTKLIGQLPPLPIGRATDHERDLAIISDPLTGLYARPYMLHRLAYEAARAARYKYEIACALFGIRNFEEWVKRRGPIGADRLLVELANLLRRNTRVVDLVGRVAEDEFLILAPHTDEVGAQAMARRMLNAIQTQALPTDDPAWRVEVCAGIAATAGSSLADNLALLARAEAALDRARTEPETPIAIG